MFQNLVWEAGGVAEVSKVEGRVAQTTNMVLGGTVSFWPARSCSPQSRFLRQIT
jgi:hypothetical protein